MIRFLDKNKVQIIRFIIVGLLSSALNFFVYNLIYFLTENINISSIFGYAVGLLNSFLFSYKWVFTNYKSIRLDRAFILFVLIYTLGGGVMAITINIIYEKYDNHTIAWLFGACLAAINNYLLSKYLIFRN